jgi:hypothetical protein
MAKVIRAVLRGGDDSNAASLPDTFSDASNLLTEGLNQIDGRDQARRQNCSRHAIFPIVL